MVPPFSGGQNPLSVYWVRGFWLSDKLVVTKGKKLSNIQLVAPNIHAEDATGMCLRFTQRVFQNKNPYYYNSAWIAWLNAVHKRYGPLPEDIAVPVYFEHWGTYGSPPTYDNWGHIAVRFPGGGVLSSPASGYGQQWFPNIESVERTFNARYVGWAYDVGGLMVADVASTPAPAPAPKPVNKGDNVKIFAGKSERKTQQQIGDKETYVTFLDDHGDSKWGDRTLMRGQATIVASFITVEMEGEPGTRVALKLIRETGAGANVYTYKTERVVIDEFGKAVAQFGLATSLSAGQLVRVKAQAQKGKRVKVTGFSWDGSRAEK